MSSNSRGGKKGQIRGFELCFRSRSGLDISIDFPFPHPFSGVQKNPPRSIRVLVDVWEIEAGRAWEKCHVHGREKSGEG